MKKLDFIWAIILFVILAIGISLKGGSSMVICNSYDWALSNNNFKSR